MKCAGCKASAVWLLLAKGGSGVTFWEMWVCDNCREVLLDAASDMVFDLEDGVVKMKSARVALLETTSTGPEVSSL